MKLHEFPRHPLTFGPSPVHPLRRLTQHLSGAQIWAKREDVSSGLAFGGNKVRKLEYICHACGFFLPPDFLWRWGCGFWNGDLRFSAAGRCWIDLF